jgi:uncharacterized protein YutE (UPF0331/DUF86 family)
VTVKPAVVLERLGHLGFVIDQLERLRGMPREDPISVLALERGLQVAAEAIFDIGHHVLAGRGRPVPPKYRDVLPALVADGVLPAVVAEHLQGLAGLRNLLVHDYGVIDAARLWELVETRLEELRQVHEALARLPELGPFRGQ